MNYIRLILLFMVAMACSSGPKPINYGTDACSYCQMTIVDRQHAAEVVTVKGKIYKYDAIECMLNDLRGWDRPEVGHYLVNDYAAPGQLINALNAHYLISDDIPSPMGEFLTAFAKAADLQSMNEVSGEKLDWNALRAKFEVE